MSLPQTPEFVLVSIVVHGIMESTNLIAYYSILVYPLDLQLLAFLLLFILNQVILGREKPLLVVKHMNNFSKEHQGHVHWHIHQIYWCRLLHRPIKKNEASKLELPETCNAWIVHDLSQMVKDKRSSIVIQIENNLSTYQMEKLKLFISFQNSFIVLYIGREGKDLHYFGRGK